jgi:hypothetical protein
MNGTAFNHTPFDKLRANGVWQTLPVTAQQIPVAVTINVLNGEDQATFFPSSTSRTFWVNTLGVKGF